VKDETIIICANAEWDWSTRVNCHHIAARLADRNRVLFVDTIGGRTPSAREFAKVWRRLKRIIGGVRRITPNLRVISPFVLPIYGNDYVRKLNTSLVAQQIRFALPRCTKPILWTFLPDHVGLVGKLKEKLVIYHCVDEHSANPNVHSCEVREREARLLKIADVVFTSAVTLYENRRKENSNTFYLPNVGDSSLFESSSEETLAIPEELQLLPHPIAGFIGNITAYKVNFDLLCDMAREKRNVSFVLIGPVGRGDPSTDITRLRGLSNVFLLGERGYASLPHYIKAFDICMIPFNQNSSTHGSLPMKFFEYMATGKPVVATDLPTLSEFRDFFYPANNVHEFVRAIDLALGEDPTEPMKRVKLARKYSWAERMLQIDKILSDALIRTTSK
jgi:glycosyltransferase involved in cell wall biosynthesis